jgi:hypothetical protein
VNPIPPEGEASSPDGAPPDGAETGQPAGPDVESGVAPLPQRIRRRTQASSKPDVRPTDDGTLDRLLSRLRDI